MLIYKVRDIKSYLERLQRLVNDPCLLFNPYLYSDEKLMEIVEQQRWRGPFSLTQMVILKFLRVEKEIRHGEERERLYYTVGNSGEEISEHMEAFTYRETAADSLGEVRQIINGRNVTKASQIHSLVGKRVFVSRIIITCKYERGNYGFGKAMRMHRLKGNIAKDAAIIREAMMDAKLEMLERLMEYPESQFYLDGTPSEEVDIKSAIRKLMNSISSTRPKKAYSLQK